MENVIAEKKVTRKRRTRKPTNPEPVQQPSVPSSTPFISPIATNKDEVPFTTPLVEEGLDFQQNDFVSSVIASPCRVIGLQEDADYRLIVSPKYKIVKETPEKLPIQQSEAPSSVIRRRTLPKTPSVEGFELEIVNPVDSVTKPRQSLTPAKNFNSPKGIFKPYGIHKFY